MGSEKQVFERFVTTVNKYALVCEGDTVLIALSGGADSVALLYLMRDLKSLFAIQICAAHLNHLLRGKESDGDERFVKQLCRKLDVPCITAKADVMKRALDEKKNLEAAAREARSEFLKKAAQKLKATKIALGHTMNDQAESMLHRMLRGSGARGLSSMRAAEGNIIRPLLWIERGRIESYLRSRKIPYRLDSSNEDLRFTRNRIRRSLIPSLKADYNPQLVAALARTAELLSEEDSFLDSLAMEILTKGATIGQGKTEIPAELIRTIHPAIARRALRCALKLVKGDLRDIKFGDIEKIRDLAVKGASGRTLLLPSGLHVTIENQVVIIKSSFASEYIRKTFQKRLKVEGRTEIDGKGSFVEATIVDSGKFTEELKAGGRMKAFLDLGKTGKELIIKNSKKGDRFHPFNSPGKKKLSDFFIDRKVPASKRAGTLVVTTKGRIAWVAGHEIDDRFKVDSKTRKILILELKYL